MARRQRGGPPPQAQRAGGLPKQDKFSQGVALHRQGKLAEAERLYVETLRQRPGHFDALHLLGIIEIQTGRVQGGVALISKAIEIKPDVAEAHNNLGNGLKSQKRHKDALASYDRAIALQPDFVEAHNNRGIVLKELERFDDALASHDTAIELRPDFVDAHNSRGNVLTDLERPEDAVASFDKAIALKPDYAEAYNNRATALKDLNRIDDALASCAKALGLQPDHASAHWNQSLCLLLLGRFEQGLPLYERREKRVKPTAVSAGPEQFWLGHEDLAGKTLFVEWEQGLGDTIQFCRYAKLAEARGARVVLSVQQPLRRLLTQLSPTIRIIGPDEQPDHYDLRARLLSLPLAFQTTPENIPAETRYLGAERQRVDAWKQRLGDDGFKVGISWQGSKGKVDIGRSFPLNNLFEIAAVPGVRLISLQKNEGTEALANMPEGVKIETLGVDFDSGPDGFLDTAAVMEHMDLVITSDTSIAHLAGALGRPTWVALKKIPDWRWSLEGSNSAWYPTMRLFRQQVRGEWEPVFGEMLEALKGIA